MSIESLIKDPKTGERVNIVEREGLNCLSVVTQEYKKYLNKSNYFINDTYGIEMANDFSSIASTENVHNGNDNTYWTGVVTTGQSSDFNFSSTQQAHTGTQSISVDTDRDTSFIQLENSPNDLISRSIYDRLSGWIYIDSGWEGLGIYLYNTINHTISGQLIDVSNYINQQNLNTWQKFNIPLSDFGGGSDYNAIRFKVTAESSVTRFYLDDLQLVELSDEPAKFILEPPKGKWWHITGLGILIVAPYDSTLADATMPKIPYNGLLGVPLSDGMLYQRTENGEVVFGFNIIDLTDILNQYNSAITSYGSDENNTWIKIDTTFQTPPTLKPEFEDFIEINTTDDLSGLERFRIVAGIREEERTTGKYDDEKR